MSENTQEGIFVFQKSDQETIEIGWRLPKSATIICCICKNQGRLTCCESLELLAKHILDSHSEIIATAKKI